MAEIIDGIALSDRLRARIGSAVQGFVEARKRPPGLAVVLVGDHPASRVYVKSKESAQSRPACAPSSMCSPRRRPSTTCSPSSRA